MALNVFYSMVREAAEQIVRREPKLAFSANAHICAILAKNYDIISGVSSLYMINQTAGIIPAEYMAVVAMNNADMTRALQMITLSLADFSVVVPNAAELMIVQSLDPANTKCNVYISPSEYVPITSLIGEEEAENEEVKEDLSEKAPAPADSGFSVPDITETPASVAAAPADSGFSVPDITETPASVAAAPQPAVSSDAMSGFFSGFGDDDDNGDYAPNESDLEKMGFITNTAPDEYKSDFSEKFKASNEQYSTGVQLDENNPFMESAPNSGDNNDIVYFAELSDNDNQQTENGNINSVPSERTAQTQPMSKEDLMKQAKQRKKVAKANFNIRRK
ncbi:MAG: hypothetical protein IKJ60_05555 [Ruminococcus sp.]|nr:hypothetical protein [Ruminococcus sp.]